MLRDSMVSVSDDRLRRTLDLLAEADRTIASSLEPTQTMPALARLLASEFADYCLIQWRSTDGTALRAVAVSPAVRIAVPGSIAEASRERLAAEGLPNYLGCPIAADGETHGTLVLAAREERPFDVADAQIAEHVAFRVALTLLMLASIRREHRVADRLQRALLPESFPTVEGLELDGAYRPAGAESEVGGDWYDAFPLFDGRVAVSIGDVAGHGLEAAVIMGEVRQALRAAVISAPEPSDVLEAVNGMLNLRENISMVTAVFGIYDPRTHVLRYAVAGHPAPIVVTADGIADVLPGGGLPLGAANAIHARDWTFALSSGSQVVLYTDGLVEHSRDVITGEQQLLDAIRGELRRGASHPATAIQERVFETMGNTDDAATLTLTRPLEHSHDVRLTYSAIPVAAGLIRSALRQYARDHSLSDEVEFKLTVAVGEAVANAVEHAYTERDAGLLRVSVSRTSSALVVEVEDDGRWRPFSRRDERGRGIPLMHAMCDGVQIKSTHASTTITLTVAIPTPR